MDGWPGRLAGWPYLTDCMHRLLARPPASQSVAVLRSLLLFILSSLPLLSVTKRRGSV